MKSFFFATASLGLAVSGCTVFSSQTPSLTVQQPVVVTRENGAKESLEAGGTIELDRNAVVIEAPGHIGMILVPVDMARTQLDVKLRPVNAWAGPDLENRANHLVNSLLPGISAIQIQLARKQAQDALAATEALQKKFPRITFLNFLKASSLFLLDRREEALASVRLALVDFPDHPQGLALLSALTGSKEEKKP